MKYHAINPYFVSFVPFFVFLVAFFYPSDAWEKIFEERNLTFLNLEAFGFVIGCFLFLYLGVLFFSTFNKKDAARKCKYIRNPFLVIMPVLLVVDFALLSYIVYLVLKFPGFVFYTFTGQGNLTKEMIARDEVDFGTLPNIIIPTIWWVWHKYYQFSKEIKLSRFVFWLIVISTALLFFVIIVNAARYALMPLIIGLFVIYAKNKIFERLRMSLHAWRSLKLYFYLILGVVFLFSAFSFARGSDGLDKLVSMILGYGPVSFNRLSYVLNGDLKFEFSTTGVYLIPEPFFYYIYSFLGIEHLSAYDVWMSEFYGVESAGLNKNFIWLSQFGYVYDSIGVFSFLYFFVYGVVVCWLWKAFQENKTYGVVLYPLIYFSIFFFFGSNYFVIFFVYYISVTLVLVLWESFLSLISTGTNRKILYFPSKNYPA